MDSPRLRALLALSLLLAGVPSMARAHQPVMDMAPRWDGGWGLQIRNEYRSSNELLSGDSKVANPEGRRRRVNTTWLEGVYTFVREIRVTAKIPWVEQSRVSVAGGSAVKQTGSGLGDAILGLQLKHYINHEASTANFGFTPSLRFPTGSTSDSYPVGDGSLDVGASLSFSHETTFFYQYYDLFYWHNSRGKRGINRGDEFGVDVNLGIHPYHNNRYNLGCFLMLDVSARYEGHGQDTAGATGGKRVSLGPILMAYWNNLMLRVDVKFPVYQHVWGSQVARGTEINAGLGVVF